MYIVELLRNYKLEEIKPYFDKDARDYKLIFQFSFSRIDFIEDPNLISVWSNPKSENDLVLIINEKLERKDFFNGFTRINEESSSTSFYFKLENFNQLLNLLLDLNAKPDGIDLIFPLAIGAFEGGGKEVFLKMNFKGSIKYYVSGGSCFSAIFKDEKITDRNYLHKVTKKDYFSEIDSLLKSSIQTPEMYREQHVWLTGLFGEYFIKTISSEFREQTYKVKNGKQYERVR